MRVRVSNIESFRQWREDEEASVEWLIDRILNSMPSEPMRVGTAFHLALELAPPGDHSTLEADGYTFLLPDAELEVPEIREIRGEKDYDGLIVTGKLDCMQGRRIDDHKTTSRVDFDRYLAGYSWRFYLDIFGADHFRWNVFPIREVKDHVYQVEEPQLLEQFRYPALPMDCARLAAEFHEFAKQHLPADFDALALEGAE